MLNLLNETTKCPHCGKQISSVTMRALDGKYQGASRYRCVALECPLCLKAISVQIDPVQLQSELIQEIRQQK